MSKYLIFSDLHLGLKKDDPLFHKVSIDLAVWMRDEARSRNIKDIIFLGDLFHNRKSVSVDTLSIASSFFDILSEFHISLIPGNHDCLYLDNSSIHSLSPFKRSGISIYDTPTILNIKPGIKLGFIPWGTKIDDIENCDYMFGHFEIVGFQFGNSFCKHGMSAESLLEKSKNIFSGHFHKAQRASVNGGYITYVGDPFQHNWGEAGQDKYIYQLDIETGELEFIENKTAPKHVLVNIDEYTIGCVDNIVRILYVNNEDNLKKLEAIKKSNPLFLDSMVIEESTNISKSISDYKSVSILDSFKNEINSLDYSNEFKSSVYDKCKTLYDLHS